MRTKLTALLAGTAVLAALAFLALSTVYAEEADLSPFYDANDNGVIDRDEVIAAVADYFGGVITRDQVLRIVQYYFSGDPVPEVEDVLPERPPSRSLNAVIEEVRPAVVYVENEGVGAGSGVIFKAQGDKGYVMTNSHVVDDVEDRLWVRTDNEEWYRATLLRADPIRDLAVLTICCDAFTAIDFAEYDDDAVGDDILVMGYPGPLLYDTATVTKGIVSAIRYDLEQDSLELQYDAATNPGNSGGPVLTVDGLIAGIHKSRYDDHQGRPTRGLGFAASVTTVQQHIDELMSPGGDFIFEGIDGSIRHDPDKNTIKDQTFWLNYVEGRADVEFETTFTNPYAASTQLWSYGLMAREDPDFYDAEALPDLRFVIDSRQGWAVTRVEADEPYFFRLAEGTLSGIKTGANATNRLKVRTVGDVARFWINGTRVGGDIDISSVPHAGNIGAFTGHYSNSQRQGAVTKFTNLRGRLLDQ